MAAVIRDYKPSDKSATYYICLKTGDHGKDGEPFYAEDGDALARIYVGPYLKFAPKLALVLEDDTGVCGYAMAVFDSRKFYQQYEHEWRPQLCEQFPEPTGERTAWSRVESAYHLYHHPDYFCPEPYEQFPSHLHIDLLPRTQGHGYGRQLINQLLDRLRSLQSPGVHLGMSALNQDAYGFYRALGFNELIRHGGAIYMGMQLS